MANNVKLGIALKLIRKQNNLTQKDLAALLNKSLPTIKKYENDEVAIPLDILEQLCSIANISFDQLWYLARINTTTYILNDIKLIFKSFKINISITDNYYIVASPFITNIPPISIAGNLSTLQEYINKTYIDFLPISNIVQNKILYISVFLYFEEYIFKQINNILQNNSHSSEYNNYIMQIKIAVEKDVNGLSMLRDIIISSNNNNISEHALSLLSDINSNYNNII